MAEVIHRYIGRDGAPDESERETRFGVERKCIDAETARQKLHQAKLLAMKGELVSKRHAIKQASFLILSLRARLLALGGTLSPRIAKACGDGDQRAIESLIDVEVRDALSEISEMPRRIADPHWIEKLGEDLPDAAGR